MYDKKECLEILRKMFTDNVNYPFNGTERVSSFDTFVEKVLDKADFLYTEEYHYYIKFPEFKDFLYTRQVDAIAHNVYIRDLC